MPAFINNSRGCRVEGGGAEGEGDIKRNGGQIGGLLFITDLLQGEIKVERHILYSTLGTSLIC